MNRYFILFFLGLPCLLAAQDKTLQSGLMPEVGFSFSLVENLEATAEIESMQTLYNSENTDVFGYKFNRLDLAGFLEYELNPFWDIAAGYQYRFQDGANKHRSTQQASLVQRLIGYRLGHRLRTDQTFSSAENPEYRFRYRLSAEFPLAGIYIDPGEYYFVASDEVLYSLQKASGDDLENRVGLAIGRYFGEKSQLEAGIDYRVESLIVPGLEHEVWLEVGWFLNL